tara:strand:+ start:379 stop:738 length:360 start_codon:yes stop_codon:yes gene_type:complete
MEAKELRIENLVNFEFHKDIGGTKAVSIVANDLINILHFEKSKFYKPIPLTEDWLLKFGFVFTNIFQGFNQYRNENVLELSITPNGYEFFFNYKWIRVKHVHQLQNLYFTLTNEELTIK